MQSWVGCSLRGDGVRWQLGARGGRFFLASAATWAAGFGGLLAISTVAMLPLTLLAH